MSGRGVFEGGRLEGRGGAARRGGEGSSRGEGNGRRSDASEYRNRRMFASIQSAIGGAPGAPTPPRSSFGPSASGARQPARGGGRRQYEEEEPAEKLTNVDDLVAQIGDLRIRGERSAAQIKRNIGANASALSGWWDEEWEAVAAAFVSAALEGDETPFVIEIIPSLMGYPDFVEAFRAELMKVASAFVLPNEEGSDRYEGVPPLLGSLVCAQWPRGMHRDTEESNPVLFTAMQIVRGWMLPIQGREEDAAPRMRRFADDVSTSDEEEEDEEDIVKVAQSIPLPDSPVKSPKGAEEDGEEPLPSPFALPSPSLDRREERRRAREEAAKEAEARIDLANRCASALAALCASQQRTLWFRQPELVDAIYKCIKPAVTHNNDIRGDVKVSLLSTLISMHDWTKTKAVNTRCSTTQTA